MFKVLIRLAFKYFLCYSSKSTSDTSLLIPTTPTLLIDLPVLLVEIVHVRHQVLHHVHVRQRVDLGLLIIGFYLGQAGKGVDASCK